VAKEGRFGVYVTDGETNASIGRGDRIDDMGSERAHELLAARREAMAEKGESPKGARSAKKAPAKKAAAKKAPAKKASASGPDLNVSRTVKKAGAKKAAKKAAPRKST
jgi:DNA topoisomerase-1